MSAKSSCAAWNGLFFIQISYFSINIAHFPLNSIIIHLIFHLNLNISSYFFIISSIFCYFPIFCGYKIYFDIVFLFLFSRAPKKEKQAKEKSLHACWYDMIWSHLFLFYNFMCFIFSFYHPLAPKKKSPKKKGAVTCHKGHFPFRSQAVYGFWPALHCLCARWA